MGDTASKDRRPIISGQRGTGVDATTNDIHERPQYRLVSPPPEEFTCSICTELLFDPVEISICDHLFCRKCVTDWLERSRTCPECRTPATFLREANRNLRNFLANLSVHCPEEFCDDIVTIAELEQHVKTCRNVQTLCEKGCEQLLLKSERKHHDCLQKLKHLLLEERTHGKDRMIQQKDTIIQELQKVINDQAKTMEEHEEILEAALRNFQGKNDLLIKENESLMTHIKRLEDETSALRLQIWQQRQEIQRKEQEVDSLNEMREKLQQEAGQEVLKKQIPQQPGPSSEYTETDEHREKKSLFSFQTNIRQDMSVEAQITSPPFEAQGFMWRVIVGRTSSHLSLYLSSNPNRNDSKTAPRAWRVGIFQLSLRRRGWTQPRTFTQYREVFTVNSPIKGFENFSKWNKARGFEKETIHVELTLQKISIMHVNPESLLQRMSRTLPFALGYRFCDAREMKINDEAYSDVFIIEGDPWKLMVKKSATNNLEAYLVCLDKEAIPTWTENCDFSFIVRHSNLSWSDYVFMEESNLKIGGVICPWGSVQHETLLDIDVRCDWITWSQN